MIRAWIFTAAATVFLTSPAAAFLFFSSGEKYAGRLEKIKTEYEASDCRAVMESVDEFFALKPPSEFKEKPYLYLARCYERERYADKALNTYEIASEIYPENMDFLFGLARLYSRAGIHDKALKLYSRLAGAAPGDWEVHAGLALSYSSLGFYLKAEKHFEKAVRLRGRPGDELAKNYVDCLMRLGKSEKAVSLARGMSDGNPEKYLSLARIYMHGGDFRRALLNAEKALEMAPERKDLAVYSMALNLMAGKRGEAMAMAEEILKKRPESEAALFIKGMVALEMKNLSRARGIFAKLSAKGEGFFKKLGETAVRFIGRSGE